LVRRRTNLALAYEYSLALSSLGDCPGPAHL
jgi:hypothetical protein